VNVNVEDITPEYIQQFLAVSAGIQLPLDEAADLVPLVRGQRAALDRLQRFSVDSVRPTWSYDARQPYRT
jgi:hypothetical protein